MPSQQFVLFCVHLVCTFGEPQQKSNIWQKKVIALVNPESVNCHLFFKYIKRCINNYPKRMRSNQIQYDPIFENQLSDL